MAPLRTRLRAFTRATLGVFALSVLFPIVASVGLSEAAPLWPGLSDVAVAFVLVAMTFGVVAVSRPLVGDGDRLVALRATHTILSAVPILLGLYFLAGDSINWTVLTSGLAWRCWLLIVALPEITAALRAGDNGGS